MASLQQEDNNTNDANKILDRNFDDEFYRNLWRRLHKTAEMGTKHELVDELSRVLTTLSGLRTSCACSYDAHRILEGLLGGGRFETEVLKLRSPEGTRALINTFHNHVNIKLNKPVVYYSD
jgi:hypothetical protein